MLVGGSMENGYSHLVCVTQWVTLIKMDNNVTPKTRRIYAVLHMLNKVT
jgi:hypothetical protein